MEQEVHRDLGRHDAQIESMQRRIDQLHADLNHVLAELQSINRVLSEARGGWKTLMAAAGLASALTAVIVKFIGYLGGGGTLPGVK